MTVTITNNNNYPEKVLTVSGGSSSDGDITIANYSGTLPTISGHNTGTVVMQASMVANPTENAGFSHSVPLTATLSTP